MTTDQTIFLAQQFEAHRSHLRGVAFRMLGSLSEAEDAVQEAWLNVTRSGADGVQNLGGWLTTVVARVCLDMLRSRKSRREDHTETELPAATDPEHETMLADSVGLALLVVLEALAPAERIAFVLHDLFGVEFDEIASIVGRSPEATRQLASRARRRVQGGAEIANDEIKRQRRVVDAFLAAMRAGDFEALVAVLDPELHVRAGKNEIHGARNWARGAIRFRQQFASIRPALVNGSVGVVLAPLGKLSSALSFTFDGDKISGVVVITEPEHLAQTEIAVLEES